MASTTPMNLQYVSLDLETTGLHANSDKIIEIGAIKCSYDSVIDEYQTLIDPKRPIPELIQNLTGISEQDVKFKPTIEQVIPELKSFIGDLPIVGQNIQFDLRFLSQNNAEFIQENYDTWELATVFFPNLPEYSLSYLGKYFQVDNQSPHRALEDAKATQQVFIKLLNHIRRCDHRSLQHIISLGKKSGWDISHLIEQCLEASNIPKQQAAPFSNARKTDRNRGKINITPAADFLPSVNLEEIFETQQSFVKYLPNHFEYRPEQIEMMKQVNQAIENHEHLIIEAGTGVGKSLAYLVPSIKHALDNQEKVVISTNTINLQEQLVSKDLPALVSLLEELQAIPTDGIKFSLLKGKSNYLCVNRFTYMSDHSEISSDEARLLSKIHLWMNSTEHGDRSEINLSSRDQIIWNRVSSAENLWCPNLRGDEPCYLKNARDRAEEADILIVNHALLLSDIRMGGTLIPHYKTLIIDEAHNLEDETTKQFQFEISGNHLTSIIDNQLKLCNGMRADLTNIANGDSIRNILLNNIHSLERSIDHMSSSWNNMWRVINDTFLSSSNKNDNNQIIIHNDFRSSQSWHNIYELWENLQVISKENISCIRTLCNNIDALDVTLSNKSHSIVELNTNIEQIESLDEQMNSILSPPNENSVEWVSSDRNRTEVRLHSAPIDVAEFLQSNLFLEKNSVICTSATLTAYNSFSHIKERLGLPEDASESQLGSPYNYKEAGLLLLPKDVPGPGQDAYISAIAQSVIKSSIAINGKTVVLFTSYAALRSVANLIKNELSQNNVQVLAQGIDGSPQQLIRRFNENPNSVILGTNSFWEGVDFDRNNLKLLIITRLPFQVPTDPIVQARSSNYENPFREYSVPQAILKFRQGIGRLIRSKEDRGTVVILDNRVIERSYGRTFLESLPDFNIQTCNLGDIPTRIKDWI